MSVLAWDEVGERRYETGVDRGVLFLPEGGAVPWNGLVSITENLGREVKPFYIDGVKYFDHQIIGDYSANLQAFTYPDELESLTGVAPVKPGMFAHDQQSRPFNFSYRTKIGNDVDSVDHGSKIHILYNVLATPGNTQFSSLGESISPQLFEWVLSGKSEFSTGIRPTSHISINTRLVSSALLANIEEALYGTATTEPRMPPLPELLAM